MGDSRFLPSHRLNAAMQESVYLLIRRAQAVALLLDGDSEPTDEIVKGAADAIADALGQARQIIETGTEAEACRG